LQLSAGPETLVGSTTDGPPAGARPSNPRAQPEPGPLPEPGHGRDHRAA
jgi:hypothetical protein